jgi:hypothetical protein
MAQVILNIGGTLSTDAALRAAGIYGGWTPTVIVNAEHVFVCTYLEFREKQTAQAVLTDAKVEFADVKGTQRIGDDVHITYTRTSTTPNPITAEDKGAQVMQQVFHEYLGKALQAAALKEYEWSIA